MKNDLFLCNCSWSSQIVDCNQSILYVDKNHWKQLVVHLSHQPASSSVSTLFRPFCRNAGLISLRDRNQTNEKIFIQWTPSRHFFYALFSVYRVLVQGLQAVNIFIGDLCIKIVGYCLIFVVNGMCFHFEKKKNPHNMCGYIERAPKN